VITHFKAPTVLVALLAFNPVAADSSDYSFLVMDRFTMSAADFDLMITGQVKDGKILSGSNACLTKANGETIPFRIDVILRSQKSVDVANTSELVALGVSGIKKDDVEPGDHVTHDCG